MKFNEDEQLDMYVAPQDYILDAVKDPENLEFETDIIGEIPELDTVEPTIFNKFTIQASPVEQAVFTDEPDAINESRCTGDMLEVGKTYTLEPTGYDWNMGGVEELELSEEEIEKLRNAGWLSEYEEIIIPEGAEFVVKEKSKYGDTIYFPAVDMTFDGLVGGDDDSLYCLVESKSEALVPVEEPVKPATKKNDSRFYIVQLLGRDGKWKTICKSLDAEYAYQIYDRWNDRIESGDTEFATDISFSDPQELMYEAMEVTELEFCKKAIKNEVAGSPEEEEALYDECKDQFLDLVKKFSTFGPINKYIQLEDLGHECPAFCNLDESKACELIKELGFAVAEAGQIQEISEPVFALNKAMTFNDLKEAVADYAKMLAVESKNEDFVSPAEENRLKLYYTDMTKDNTSIMAADKTVEFAKYAFPQLSEDTVRKIAAETYLDICIDRYFEQNPDTEEIPQDKYDEFIAEAEKMAGSKLSARYYESKNERGGSDYGSFYNMFADALEKEGYEGLKKIAWYCDLGMEFSGIANAIHSFPDADYKAINKRAYKIFDAINSLVVSYWEDIQGAALYFNSLGKQDKRFNNMITDMFEDYQLSVPNISGDPDSISDLVDDIISELPKSIELSRRGLRELTKIIDSIIAPQGAMGTKKAIKVQLKAALDKEIAIANKILAVLKQEWPEGIQPQKRMFRGPQDADQLAYEIHQVLGEDMYKYDLGNGDFYITNTSDEHEFSTSFDVAFYFHVPEGKVRVRSTARPENFDDDYTQEAVYKLPTDINELAQNAIMLYNDAVKEMQNSLDEE